MICSKIPLLCIFSKSGHVVIKSRLRFFNIASNKTLATAAAVTKMSAKKESCGSYRLPKNIVPHHYDISLTPDLVNFTFDGSENVHIYVQEATKTVLLNALNLDISKVTFTQENGDKELVAQDVALCEDSKIATITFPDQLPINKSGILHLEFQGKLNEEMAGFYRSKYTSTDGATKYAAVTQFEAVDARRCFPCWDEPAVKATFDITLTVPAGLTALSNMPVKTKETLEGGALEKLTYETTPKMSTYLVALVVGEFDYVEGKSEDGTLVRVYTPLGKKEQGSFALEVAAKALPYYNEYFGIPYPLPKMDLVALADFSAGAMENWGLVTYRESCLLVDPQNTSTANKQTVVICITHEIAHQWFGNLVTMEWWTHLWLNEGYASFMEFMCTDKLFPKYNIWMQFVTSFLSRAQELDSLRNTHAIEVDVENPYEIDEIFDEISYNKGASVIRMLHAYIGGEKFREGMKLYLQRHTYGNALTEDLWATLEEASGKPVTKVMSAWTRQAGFPLVKVKELQKATSPSQRVLSFSQRRFILTDGSSNNEVEDNAIWPVPLSIARGGSGNLSALASETVMEAKEQELVLDGLGEGDWLKVNPGAVGFYRVQYGPEMLARLVPAIEDRSLPTLDRFSLLDDSFATAKAGQASTVETLKLLSAYRHEDSYAVWTVVAGIIGTLDTLLGHLPDAHEPFQRFCREILRDVSRRVGWIPPPSGESHLDTLLRTVVLGKLVSLEDPETLAEAKDRLERHLSGSELLPADLRSFVYRAYVMSGGEAAFDRMVELYKASELHEEQDRILMALGAAPEPRLLRRALEFAVSDNVRAQDTVYVLPSACRTHQGRCVAWEWAQENWAQLTKRCNSGGLRFRLVQYLVDNFATEQHLGQVEAFFQKHSPVGAERTVKQSLEKIRLNVAWLKRDQASIKHFFSTALTDTNSIN